MKDNLSMHDILHLGKYYHPDRGGIESVTKSIAEATSRSNCITAVICFSKYSSNIDDEFLNGVKVIRTPILFTFAQQPIGFRYLFNAFLEARNTKIIHLHAPNMVALFSLFFIPKRISILIHWHSDVINKGLLAKILKPLEFYALQRATKIIAATDVYANSSSELKKFKSKVIIIPYGVNDKHHAQQKKPINIINKINSRKIILSIGRLVPYKGFDVLIDAAIDLPIDTVIVIVGNGPLHDQLHKKVAAMGITDKVILAGNLENTEVSYLLSIATIYCLPSTYRAEAFGVVLLEALAYSLPLVVSNIPGSGAPWINIHGETGLNFTSGDAKSLARSCIKILQDDVLLNELKSGARKRFLAEFTSDIFHQRMLNLYGSILSNDK